MKNVFFTVSLLCLVKTAQLMRRYAEKRLQDEKGMKDLVQQVAEGHKNSKSAKEKLQKLKQRIGEPPQVPFHSTPCSYRWMLHCAEWWMCRVWYLKVVFIFICWKRRVSLRSLKIWFQVAEPINRIGDITTFAANQFSNIERTQAWCGNLKPKSGL